MDIGFTIVPTIMPRFNETVRTCPAWEQVMEAYANGAQIGYIQLWQVKRF
jgi:hypothetical protein